MTHSSSKCDRTFSLCPEFCDELCHFLSATRFRLIKHTRLNVVAFLNELPKTQHDIASFIVDVNTYTVSYTCGSVCWFHILHSDLRF